MAASGRSITDRHATLVFGVPGEWAFRRCDDCASLWLDPRPSDDALPDAYRSYYTHAEPESPPGGDAAKVLLRRLPWQRDLTAAELGYLPPLTPGRVLDLGCGDGRTSLALRAAGWDVVSVDVDPVSIERATARGVVDARVGGIGAADDLAPFDAVVLSHVLEHVIAPGSLLTEIRSRLVEGGRLAVRTPNAMGASSVRFGSAWRGLEPPRHLQIFSPHGLEQLIIASGLRVERLSSSAVGANGVARAAAEPTAGGLARLRTYAAAEMWQAKVARRLRKDPWGGEELIAIAVR